MRILILLLISTLAIAAVDPLDVNTSQVGGNDVSTDAGSSDSGTIRVTLPNDQVAIPVSGISGTISLPTGAATEAKQDTGNTSLSSIDSKLTNPLPVSGSMGRTWSLSSGSDSVSASVSNFPSLTDINITQILGAAPSVTNWIPARISNGSSYVDPTQIRALTSSDQVTIANPTLAVTQSGIFTTGRTWSLTSGSDSVTSVQGTNPWVTSLTDGASTASIKAASSAALAADTSLVVALSPNSALPSGSNTIGALTANQSVNVNQYGGTSTTLGQKTMTASVPVTVASDQPPVNIGTTVVTDANNTTTATLGAGATFTGTATDITNYSQINLSLFGRPNILVSGDGTDAKASLFFEFSPDSTNWDISVPILVRTPGIFIPYPLINVHKYFRVRYLNDGGVAAITALGLSETAGTPTAQTEFRMYSYQLPLASKELARTLDQSVSGSDPVSLGRNVIMGKNPNLTYSNLPATGTANDQSSNALLGIGATFNAAGPIVDMSGYVAASATVVSDVNSAANGLMFSWYADAAGTRSLGSTTFTYGNSPLRTSVNVPRHGPYLRVTYTNGAVAQASFELITTLLVTAPPPDVLPIASTITGNNAAQIVKANVVGLQENGIYANVGLSNAGSMKVAVTDRPSEVRNRIAVKKFITGTALVAAPGTTIHTPAVGKTFYLNSFIASCLNTAATNGEWTLQDGADTTDRVPFLMAPRVSGSNPSPADNSSPSMPEPIPFTTDVRAIELLGDVTCSITIVGYDE